MKKCLLNILVLTAMCSLGGCGKEPVGDPPIVDEEYFYVDEKNEELEIKEDEGFPDWGITLSVKDVTDSGLTLVCTQSGGEADGELQTGSDYKLIVLKEAWEDVPTIIEDYGWTAEAYMIAKDDVTEFNINWEWLYGKLPEGTYRLVKGFMNFRGSGDYDNFPYWIEFEIN